MFNYLTSVFENIQPSQIDSSHINTQSCLKLSDAEDLSYPSEDVIALSLSEYKDLTLKQLLNLKVRSNRFYNNHHYSYKGVQSLNEDQTSDDSTDNEIDSSDPFFDSSFNFSHIPDISPDHYAHSFKHKFLPQTVQHENMQINPAIPEVSNDSSIQESTTNPNTPLHLSIAIPSIGPNLLITPQYDRINNKHNHLMNTHKRMSSLNDQLFPPWNEDALDTFFCLVDGKTPSKPTKDVQFFSLLLQNYAKYHIT